MSAAFLMRDNFRHRRDIETDVYSGDQTGEIRDYSCPCLFFAGD